MIKLLVFCAVLCIYYANAAVFQGGSVTFTILEKTPENVVVRFFNKFLLSVTTSDLAKCDGDCLSDKIGGESILAGPTTGGTKNDTKKIDSSFYCDLAYRKDKIIIGSRETDLRLFRKFDRYDFSYADCCTQGTISGTYTLVHSTADFKAFASLKNRTDKIDAVNNVPDTRFTPIYVEFKSGAKNEHKISVFDLDNDLVRCDWISDICQAEPCTSKYTKKSFSLFPNCSLVLTDTISVGYYSIGIAVRDFYQDAKDYKNPLSQLPLFLVVKVIGENDNIIAPDTECPADRKKPIENQIVNSSSMIKNSLFSFYIINILIALLFSLVKFSF